MASLARPVAVLLLAIAADAAAADVTGLGAARPLYENTVLQSGVCNITSEDGLDAPVPVIDMPHLIPTAFNPNYGLHVVAQGRDNRIYHKHQASNTLKGAWSKWKCLTPDFTKVPCSAAPHCGGYDNNPVIAWQPKNGTLVVFVRQQDDLTVHEMHLADPRDPDSWTPLRGPACLCNFGPCTDKNQTRCGLEANCDNKGVDCAKHPNSGLEYWNVQPAFPTSELTLLPTGDKLTLIFRGFDGAYYRIVQGVAGDAAGKYGPPSRVGVDDAPDSIIE